MKNQPYLRIKFKAPQPGKKHTCPEIVQNIKEQILRHRLSGLRLPPIRFLAHQLNVSKTTIQKAYDELISQGLVESKPRLGLYITPAQKEVQIPSVTKAAFLATDQGPAYLNYHAPPSPKTINLSSDLINPDLLPLQKISQCFRAALANPDLTSKYYVQGYPPLRKEIAERLQKYGINAHPDNIVITIGSQQAISIIFRSLTGATIATENPTYYAAQRLFKINKNKIIGLPLDPFQEIQMDLWAELIQKYQPQALYLIPNFQNPTGHSYSSSELQQILLLSKKFNLGLIEDDWGSDMLSFSEFKPSLRAIGGENVFYLNTFTSKLLPSLRIGYVLASTKNIPSLLYTKSASCLAASSIDEIALYEFLYRGYYDAHLTKLQQALDKRYKFCLKILRERMPANIKWTLPGGGPMLWLEVPRHISLEKVSSKLQKQNIYIDLN
ncbi:PLP-dependent aminotransferase family protein, partial [bacterium]|nr:PLP-dependent aminotransferase family protein [bacterium]